MVNLGEAVLDVLAHRKFHQDLKEHVKLPYTKWWLDQEDPYILAKKPEILNEKII